MGFDPISLYDEQLGCCDAGKRRIMRVEFWVSMIQ